MTETSEKLHNKTITDKAGHYDMDGVSVGNLGTIVAGDNIAEPPRELTALKGQNLEEIQNTADSTSLKLKQVKSTRDDTPVDKSNSNTISSAKYYPGYEPYLKDETPG